jgi:hypothetical protein
LSARAVVCSLCPRRWKGFMCVVGAFQALATTSWKPGRRDQKFSNLKGVGCLGASGFVSSSGQWSECEEDRALRAQFSKVSSQGWLQKARSRQTRLGWRHSLLQVNFLF